VPPPFGLASFRGRLHVTAEDGAVTSMTVNGRADADGSRTMATRMGVHNGWLYAGVLNPAGIWEYNGASGHC
jgi:hypothetical protein